jgi:hypothetical protein
MSKSPTARPIDSEIGDLSSDLIGPAPLLSYLRYNVELEPDALSRELGLSLPAAEAASLSEMDDPKNMERLKQIGERVGAIKVQDNHFPDGFNI